MSTGRYATPSGVTVEQITLSQTPNPSKPGDPAKHYQPREYLRRTGPRDRDRWYSPSLDDLAALAEHEGWQLADLAELPTYAVLDTTAGGKAVTHGADGHPFDLTAAARYAETANAAMGPGHRYAHRVVRLSLVDVDQVEEAAA